MPKIELDGNFVKTEIGYLDFEKKFYDNRTKTGSWELYLTFDEILHYILGFPEISILKPHGKSKYPIDLFGNNHAIFVYTNIIVESFVGNKKSQLLRIIPLEKSKDTEFTLMKSVTFNPIIYYPIRQQTFDMIKISLRDSTGKHIEFESGKVIITLSFKPK